MAKSNHAKDDNKEEVYVPAQLVFGVTLAVSSVVIYVLSVQRPLFLRKVSF
jgi:hypothetical protein